jgi:hypothetical protein
MRLKEEEYRNQVPQSVKVQKRKKGKSQETQKYQSKIQ